MATPTSIQTINGPDGKPAFVVIPYSDYLRGYERENDLVPHEVVRAVLKDGIPPVRAWREYLGLTQTEVAARLGVKQPSYAEQENSTKTLRKSTRDKIATALGITSAQLDV